MSNEPDHNKLIIQAARSVLKPMGLFQKGQSRMWIDDNGWFLILVEFQPSGFAKGSYLNVGIYYLWRQKDYLSFDFGYREEDLVTFTGDQETFSSDMIRLVKKAESCVKKYREFINLEIAHGKILDCNNKRSRSIELYNKLFVCGLAKNTLARVYFDQLFAETQNSYNQWEIEIHDELNEYIIQIIDQPDELYLYIKEKIRKNREYWCGKSSMRLLHTSWD